ncbi:MAG: S41 family peptidase [Crocinitomicaceae bacterium]
MRIPFSLLLIIGGCLISLLSFGQQFSKSDLLADLQFMDSAFRYGHPMNLIENPKIEFAPSIARVTKNLPDSISKIQYENVVREVLMEVHCSHTNVDSWSKVTPKKNVPTKFFPFYVFTDGHKIWILEKMNDSVQSTLQRGDEVLSINGHKTDSVLTILKNYHPQDGVGFDLSAQMINELFPPLFAKCIDRDSVFHVQSRNHEGKLVSTTESGWVFKKKEEIDKEIDVLGNQAYFSLLKDTIGYLRISSIESREQEFYDRVFQRIADRKLNYLVLDLRNNTGGSLFSSADLISYFAADTCAFSITFPKQNMRPFISAHYRRKSRWNNFRWKLFKKFTYEKTQAGTRFTSVIYPKERLHFGGKIFVLTNGYTASGSSFITAYAKHHAKAVVIGQKTGGGEFWNSAGIYAMIQLPKSGLRIQTATTHMQSDFPMKHFNGIEPDFPILYDPQTYGIRDLELETVFELIGTK